MLAERLEVLAPEGVEVLTDYQLQIEHALDLQDRQRVIFADAAADGREPFMLAPVFPAHDASYTTHALSPAALLHHCRRLAVRLPDAHVLAIRGYDFELGAPLSAPAQLNLQAALEYLLGWLDREKYTWRHT